MQNHKKSNKNPEALLLVLNQEGFCTRVNSICYQQTGYLPAEIIGKRFKDLLLIQPEELLAVQQKLSESDDSVIAFEAGFKCKGGQIVQYGFHIFWSDSGTDLICTGNALLNDLNRKLEESNLLKLKNSLYESLWQTNEPEEIFESLCRILVREAGYSLTFVAALTDHGLDIWFLDSSQKLNTHQLKRTPVLEYLYNNLNARNLDQNLCEIVIPAGDLSKSLGGISDTEKKLLAFPLTKTETSQWILAVCKDQNQDIATAESEFLLSVVALVNESLNDIQKENKISDAEEALKKYIKELNLLVEINNQILIHNSEPELIKGVLDVLIEKGGYRLAWFMYFEKGKEKEGIHIPQYYSGQVDYAKSLRFDLNNPDILKGPTATSMLTGKTTIIGSAQDDPDYVVWKSKAKEFGLSSSISVCLDLGDNNRATLSVYSGRTNSFDAREVLVMERFKHNLAFAISRIRRIHHSASLLAKAKDMERIKNAYKNMLQQTLCVAIVNESGEILESNNTLQRVFSLNPKSKKHPLLSGLNTSEETWELIEQSIAEHGYFQSVSEHFSERGISTEYELWIFAEPESDPDDKKYLVLSFAHQPMQATAHPHTQTTHGEDLARLMRTHLRELKQITSQEISHEFHKLQAMSELVSDLDFADDELKEIISHTAEIFEKTDQALRHLMSRITEPLNTGFLSEENESKQYCIIIDSDKLSADINYKILSKFIQKENIFRFGNFSSSMGYLDTVSPNSQLLIVINTLFPENEFIQFTKTLEEKNLRYPIVLTSPDTEDPALGNWKEHKWVKACFTSPLSKPAAENIQHLLLSSPNS